MAVRSITTRHHNDKYHQEDKDDKTSYCAKYYISKLFYGKFPNAIGGRNQREKAQ